MSVASPPRPAPARTAPRQVVEERPLRYPDTGSREVMTRRGWWLVLLNFLLPGSAQALAGNRRLGRIGLGATLAMWVARHPRRARRAAVATAVPSASSPARGCRTGSASSAPLRCCSSRALLLAYAVLWIVLTIDTLRLVRLVKTGAVARFGIARRSPSPFWSAARAAAVYASQIAGTTRDTLGSIFGASGPSGSAERRLLQHPAARRRQRRGPRLHALRQHLGRLGERRRPARPRSPASRATCRTFPFSAGPDAGQYPDGHDGHADSTLRLGKRHQPAAHRGRGLPGRQRSLPGCRRATARSRASRRPRTPRRAFSASRSRTTSSSTCTASRRSSTRSAASTSPSRSDCPRAAGPSYDGQPAEEWATGWIEAGPQHMDGDTAQWYARSRYTTERLRPDEAAASAAGGDPRAVHARRRARPDSRTSRPPGRTSSRPTCRSRCSRSSPSSRSRRRSSPVTTIELTPDGGIDEYEPGLRLHPGARAAGAAPADPDTDTRGLSA